MLKRFIAPVFLCLAFFACAPSEGDSCDKANSGTCESDTEVLWCEGGKYKLLNCRGATGCSEDKDKEQVSCDVGNLRAGDPCLASQENTGQCDASNANQAVICQSGTIKAETCKSCALQNGQIVCSP